MLILFTIISCAFMFAIRGGLANDLLKLPPESDNIIPRWVYFINMGLIASMWSPSLAVFACHMATITIIGAFPTHAMFSAITGRYPERKDAFYFQWMQPAAYLWSSNAYEFGILYAAIRNSIALIPAVVCIHLTNNALYLFALSFPFIGLLYHHLAHARKAEAVTGALMGIYFIVVLLQ